MSKQPEWAALIPVHSSVAGCVGHLRRTSRGFVAYDAGDKIVGIFADADHAAQALLDQQSNGRRVTDMFPRPDFYGTLAALIGGAEGNDG